MSNKINSNFWKNKKVFVTGHTGFKGSWLCIILNLLGAKITGYALKPKSSPNLFNLAKVEDFIDKSIIADVRDFKSLHKELKPYENDPYERRAFLYLDILSWLESKILNMPISKIIQEKASKNLPLRKIPKESLLDI